MLFEVLLATMQPCEEMVTVLQEAVEVRVLSQEEADRILEGCRDANWVS